jgi:hypothetical protein
MDEEVLEQMLRGGKVSAEDLLRQTAADRVDGAVEILLRHLPYDVVLRALHERVRRASRADYMILRTVYFKCCDRAPAIGQREGRAGPA